MKKNLLIPIILLFCTGVFCQKKNSCCKNKVFNNNTIPFFGKNNKLEMSNFKSLIVFKPDSLKKAIRDSNESRYKNDIASFLKPSEKNKALENITLDEINFPDSKLLKYNIENLYISKLLDSTYKLYKGIDTLILNSILRHLKIDTNKIFVDLQGVPIDNPDNKKRLQRFPFAKIDTLYNQTKKKNKDWIKNWEWYYKSEKDSTIQVKLNPFEFSLEDKIKISKEKELISEIDLIKNRLKLPTINAIEFSNQLIILKNRENDLAKVINLKKRHEDWFSEISMKNELLYQINLPQQKTNKPIWMYNYDASNSFNLVNDTLGLIKPYSVFIDDEMIIAVHNIPETMKISLKSKEVSFEVVSKLESEIINPLFNEFDKAISANPFIQNSLDSNLKNLYVPNENSNDDFATLEKNYKCSMKNWEWLIKQTAPPFSKLNLVEDISPKFRTEILYPERKLEGNLLKKEFQIFNNNKDDSLVASGNYFKYKKVNFLPTVGVSFIPKSRINSVYDENTGFSTDKFYNNIEVFAGVKWYPWGVNRSWDKKTSHYLKKLNYEKHNREIGSNWTNRISATLALGTSKKLLRNYNLGVGWDPIPGFNFQIGCNLYIQNTYKITNGIIIDQSIKPNYALYYGLSVDLGIASQISKLFIKSK